MATAPMKKTGFRQGIYEISATAKEVLGTRRILRDGREFVYAKAGASALSVGKMAVAADIAAEVSNQALPATAIGATSLVYTASGAVTYAADYFKGGFLQINDATGEGAMYEIVGSTAVTAGTSITIVLGRPIINTALTTSSEGSLIHHPCMATIESADEENMPVGVSPVAVTAAYYYWAQTKGLANVLVSGTIAVFDMVVLGATAGSVKTLPDYGTATDPDMPLVGQAYRAGVDTEYTVIKLNL